MNPRNAQSLILGCGKLVGAVQRTHNGTAQVDCLLQDLSITSTNAAGAPVQGTLITAIRVAGQRLDVSNQPADPNFANPQTRQTEGTGSISLPIAAQQVFSIDLTTPAAGDFTGVSVGVDSIVGPPIPVNEISASALSYVAGLGTVVGGAGNFNLQATILRPVMLGRIGITPILTAGADINLLTVTSVTLNGLELLASNTANIVEAVPLEAFSWTCDDNDGLSLGVPCNVNDVIIVTINCSAAPAGAFTVQGAILIMPELSPLGG